jgi:hypothetical protein
VVSAVAVRGHEGSSRAEAGVGLGEVVLVFALYGLVATAILITYARLPARDFYHVSQGGLDGGGGRALVFLNFSTALAVVATLPFALAHLRGRIYAAAGIASLLLCAVVIAPGVVDQADLDPKWVNVFPALGVGMAITLTGFAVRAAGDARMAARCPGDGVRIVLAGVLFILSLPWILADLGIEIGRLPLLGSLFVSEELWAPFGEARVKTAVHHGHHHGLDGFLLSLTALALSRPLAQLRNRRVRALLGFYLSLMLAYGLANLANDVWLEQLVKRGVTSWAIPSVLEPRPSLAWAVVLILAAAFYMLAFRRSASPRARRALPLAAPGILALAGWVAVVTALGGAAIARGKPVGATVAVPDRVAFPMVDQRYDIFVLAEGVLRNVTDDSSRDLAPDWAPDAQMLAFQSDRDGNADVFVVRADGTGLRRLTVSPANDGEPAWSPDGRTIAFVTERAGNRDIYVMGADGSRQRPLAATPGDDEWPSWSPDGRTVAFSSDDAGGFDLYVVAADGTAMRRVTDGPGDDRSPSWSPDGGELVFASDRGGDYDLYVVGASGDRLRQLTRGAEGDFAPSFSPDGHVIVFVSDRAGRDQLFAIDATGGARRQLTAEEYDKDVPRWAP